jgi:sigma-B regulation protein RsbU (phosphoserine phosphatase)
MSERAFALTVPADSRYLKVVRAFFAPVLEEVFGEEAALMILALDESCSNIVKHRSGVRGEATISVRIAVHDHEVEVRLGDFCAKADIPKIKPRELEDLRPGGLGTHFIDQIMDHVAFEADPNRPDRMDLVLKKKKPEGKATDDHQG